MNWLLRVTLSEANRACSPEPLSAVIYGKSQQRISPLKSILGTNLLATLGEAKRACCRLHTFCGHIWEPKTTQTSLSIDFRNIVQRTKKTLFSYVELIFVLNRPGPTRGSLDRPRRFLAAYFSNVL